MMPLLLLQGFNSDQLRCHVQLHCQYLRHRLAQGLLLTLLQSQPSLAAAQQCHCGEQSSLCCLQQMSMFCKNPFASSIKPTAWPLLSSPLLSLPNFRHVKILCQSRSFDLIVSVFLSSRIVGAAAGPVV